MTVLEGILSLLSNIGLKDERGEIKVKSKSGVVWFLYYVNHLIDEGYKEEIDIVEQQIEKNSIVQYIGEKYKDLVDFSPFKINTYSIDEVNQYFNNFTGYVEGNESRKYIVSNNGLNLIVALGLDILNQWFINQN